MVARLILISALSFQYVFANDPIAETTIGTIRGVLSSDGNINMFLGIPYASINESNPFGSSFRHPGFDAVYEAKDDSFSICPQRNNNQARPPQADDATTPFVGHPDCLHLNVYTPSSSTANSRLPVMFWIYGGGYSFGNFGKFLYGPDFLVRHDVIFVTVNYRVGPYGFMCLDIPEVPGNQGLKDTLLALQWVKEHIASFGGDPDQVTVFGNSAGAQIVDFHMMRDDQLFQKAILTSGTTQVLVAGPPVTNAPVLIANELGYQTDDVRAAIAFLATVPSANVLQASNTFGIRYWPCVEKEFEGVEAFLTESVSTAEYYVRNISIVIGITDDEQLVMQRNNDDPRSVDVVLGLRFDTQHDNFTGPSDVRSFYYGDEESSLRATADLYSDIHFNHPTYRVMNRILKSSPERLYSFLFAYDGNRNFMKIPNNVVGGGAAHADELGYLFSMDSFPETPTPEDYLMIEKFTTLWTNFAKYGSPTPETSPLLPVQWTPVTATSPHYCLRIDEDLSLITRPFHDRMTFWDLFYEANGHLSIVAN